MSDTQRNILRSIGAVFAGFVLVVALSLGTDKALRMAGIFPAHEETMPNPLFLLATVYRTIYGVLGSYVTALLAPSRPMKHSLLGGAIGMAAGLAGAIGTWNMNLGPHWYPIALVATALPGAWLGAKLRLTQLGSSAEM